MDLGVKHFKEGECVEGVVRSFNDFGVFLDVGAQRDALLPWGQVEGCGPLAGETLHVVVASVDAEPPRATLTGLTVRLPVVGAKAACRVLTGRGRGAHSGTKTGTDPGPVGGWVYDVALGARARRKGGKGDGRGSYTYADGMPFSDVAVDDDVSGHITNIEKGGCWVDIGALKDGFLRWEDAPRSAMRWQVGDMIDDLKVMCVRGAEVGLMWDGEGISSLKERDWERLFAVGPPMPPPRDPFPKQSTGENCCATYAQSATHAGGQGVGAERNGRSATRSCHKIGLRARSAPAAQVRHSRSVTELAIGDVVTGRITGLSRAGALVDFGCEAEGLIPRALVTMRCRKGEVIAKLNIMGIDAELGKVTLEPLEEEEASADEFADL